MFSLRCARKGRAETMSDQATCYGGLKMQGCDLVALSETVALEVLYDYSFPS